MWVVPGATGSCLKFFQKFINVQFWYKNWLFFSQVENSSSYIFNFEEFSCPDGITPNSGLTGPNNI